MLNTELQRVRTIWAKKIRKYQKENNLSSFADAVIARENELIRETAHQASKETAEQFTKKIMKVLEVVFTEIPKKYMQPLEQKVFSIVTDGYEFLRNSKHLQMLKVRE